MRVLGIESSCDETAAAVVEDGRSILSNAVYTQEADHRPFRGIVPEIASRAHLETINGVIERALRTARCEKPDAIAVTVGPGLVGSLLVGKMTAEALGWAWNVPVVGVNHLEAHVLSPLLEHMDLQPPFLGFVVSGGHTDLVVVDDFGRYRVLGRTRDDSAGESFDKVANLLEIGYPGGPAIDRLARRGNEQAVAFPRPYLDDSWDFSFSGLKTAVLYHVQELRKAGQDPRGGESRLVRDLCASFQAAVVDVLVRKAVRASVKFGLKAIAVGGGVSANSRFRAQLAEEGRKRGLKIFFPAPGLSTDNAAMIACAGAYKLQAQGAALNGALRADPSLPMANWSA